MTLFDFLWSLLNAGCPLILLFILLCAPFLAWSYYVVKALSGWIVVGVWNEHHHTHQHVDASYEPPTDASENSDFLNN